MAEPGIVLQGKEDSYRGITISEFPPTLSAEEFQRALEGSVVKWVESGKRCAWLRIPSDRAELIPPARAVGFTFHHAKPEYLMMLRWLSETDPNHAPAYASTQVGVGGVVLNARNEILMIQERFPRLPNFWKVPGGLVEAGEDLAKAVEREVLEETGVPAQFQCLLGASHRHNAIWGMDDIYFMCLLRTDFDGPLTPPANEIAKCEWMKREDLTKLEHLPYMHHLIDACFTSEHLGAWQLHEYKRPFGTVQLYSGISLPEAKM
eukprot:TRINITY_DN53654_c0_g1_i1.p1 TRINITY_DN53654_c0_g1~~TRINITY_DN53654_c0_g1_i1.p1  ORF type:complete len:280 (-),score=49.85 TRINITY_DN53654_c0_g1_i1:49-837(-)